MAAVMDFIRAAFPWITIGLAIAVFMVMNVKDGKNADDERSLKDRVLGNSLFLFPSIAFFLVGIMEFADHDKGSGTTWFVLGVCFLVLRLVKGDTEEK